MSKILGGIKPFESTFLRTAFRAGDYGKHRLFESISRAALYGFHNALRESEESHLGGLLDALPPETRGFGYVGAGMGLTLLAADNASKARLTLSRLTATDFAHRFMVYLGSGWALARLPLAWENADVFLPHTRELLRWVPLVGYGEHQAFFHWSRYVEDQIRPSGLSCFGYRAFDQGIGTVLWYGEGGNEERAAVRISMFPPVRQPDLWSGLGFGCAYAGQPSRAALLYLREASGPFASRLSEGAALAAVVREDSRSMTTSTDLACRSLCHMSAGDAAAWVRQVILEADSNLYLLTNTEWQNTMRWRF